MVKLVILIEPSVEWSTQEGRWPEFLHLTESMPGLRREAISRVEQTILGTQYDQIYELFFDSLEDAQKAMTSDPGRAAGKLLQQMTGGHMVLLFAEHKEDDMENIRKYKNPEISSEQG